MSNSSQNGGCFKPLLYIVLGLTALWPVWKLLRLLYSVLGYAAANLFLGLDLSYGRLGAGGWPGYALLGLGLGAAAGAVAAQRRFRLNGLIVVAAATFALALLSVVYIGTTARSSDADAPQATTEEAAAPAETKETDLADAAEPPTATVRQARPSGSKTASKPARLVYAVSQPAHGLRQVAVSFAPLRPNWADSLARPQTYLHKADTVRLLRRAQQWVKVAQVTTASATASTGWIRAAALQPLRAAAAPKPRRATPTVAATAAAATAVTAKPVAPVAAAAAVNWPLGHRQYTGRVGQLPVAYSLDWQKDGVCSGSYAYDSKPGTVYRLTGAGTASGELRLVEFTRGRQSARCVLQRQGVGFVGTMFNTDGQQFSMSLE